MTARRITRAALLTSALTLAGGVSAQDGSKIGAHAASPAVALTPQPLATYVPPPVPVADEPEPTTSAKLDTPVAIAPTPVVPAPEPTDAITPVVHRRKTVVTAPTLPPWQPTATMSGSQGWRWYGWGAATPHGNPGGDPRPQGPGSNLQVGTPPAPEKSTVEPPPATVPKPDLPKSEPPKPETPKPGLSAANVPPLPVPAPVAEPSPAGPVAAPPTVDLGPSPAKPVPAPPVGPTISDPWTSVPGTSAKLLKPTTARASSQR